MLSSFRRLNSSQRSQISCIGKFSIFHLFPLEPIRLSQKNRTSQPLSNSRLTYEILISDREIPDDLVHPGDGIRVVPATRSPLLTTAEASAALYVGVRAVSDKGYYSDLSEVHTLKMEGE